MLQALRTRPYFLTNKEWYIENEEWSIDGVPYFLIKGAKKPKYERYILTDKAPPEAIDSYNKYYRLGEYAQYDINKISP